MCCHGHDENTTEVYLKFLMLFSLSDGIQPDNEIA